MANCCGNFGIEDQYLGYEIDCCTIRFYDLRDGNTLCLLSLITMDIKKYTSNTYGLLDGVSSAQISQDELDAIGLTISDIEAAMKECRCSQPYSVSHFERMRISDCKCVIIEACKDDMAEIIYKDLDSGAIVTLSDLQTLYTTCSSLDTVQDIKEYEVGIPLGGGSEIIATTDKYDAVSIENMSGCPMLVSIDLELKDGSTITRKVTLRSGQSRSFDWSMEVITGIEVGEYMPTGGVVEADTLVFANASQDLDYQVTFFNS